MRRPSRLPLLLLLAGLLAPVVARADVVRLKNGRALEGRIVKRTAGAVHVQLATGDGVMIVPMATVAAIETRSSSHEELAELAVALDPGDPDAVQALARWASSRGLGEEAQDLNALAFGVRLDQRVTAAREARSARDFADIFRWARERGASDDVLAWLVAQAEGLCRDDPEVQDAAVRLARDRAAEQARLARQEELRRRPHYLDPGKPRPVFGSASLGARADAPDPGARGRALIVRLVGTGRAPGGSPAAARAAR